MAWDDIVGLSIGITIPFVIICTLSFVLRVYSRVYIAKSFGADDWAMVAAFIFWVGQQAITYCWVRYGAGRHLSQVSDADYLTLRTYLFAEEFYYLWVQLLIKFSFLLFYLRFLGMTTFRYAIFTVMGLVVVQVVGTWIFYGLQCRPIGAYLHPERYPGAKCLTTGISYYAPTAANVIVDIIIYALPVYPLWHLQATRRKRLELITVMTLGGCTILVSGLRMIVLYDLATKPDFTYIFGRVVIVTTIEFVTAIVTANMPAIKTVWAFHVTKTFTTIRGSHELDHYGECSRKVNDGRMVQQQIGGGINQASVSNDRPISPTESEAELVKGQNISVLVKSEWQVRSDSYSGYHKA
ncbi:hypothetical protein AAFC00_001933 [Neodothiora populina]|uniref:Rhodopsin domain-containing protein n=1 Tax=Neodothiora populina TaxID=2781224 RepID=A0ABR3PQT3_9PEZI